MSGVKRGLLAVLVAVTMVACTTSGGDNRTPPPTEPVPEQPPSPWRQTLDQRRPDGTVSAETALSAFAQAIGPVPGVESPGQSDDIYSGTIAVRWVFAHWDELTDEQRTAVYETLAGTTNKLRGQPAPTPVDPAIPCRTQDASDAERYRKMLDKIIPDLQAHLPSRDWSTFSLPTTIVLGGTRPSGAYAWTYGCVGDQEAPSSITRCTIHVGDKMLAMRNDAEVRDLLVHEAMHCFILDEFGVDREANMADWFGEGFPTWVQVQLGRGKSPFGLRRWHDYLTTNADQHQQGGYPLWKHEYSGMGFFVHLAETGVDPWDVAHSIGQAMSGGSDPTAAGWNTAHVNDVFVQNWASGYARGRYPGPPWQTTGRYLDSFVPPKHPAVPLNEGAAPVSMISAPTAPNLYTLDVRAEVVQFAPNNTAHGRISLGGGKDATLEDAKTATYCTLAPAECKCPSDSAKAGTRFTHLNKGEVWVGLTGGLAAAQVSAAGMSLDEFCGKKPSCVTGTWTVTKITGQVAHPAGTGVVQDSAGGAGIKVKIEKNGTITVDYSKMVRVDSVVHPNVQTGYTIWRGTQHGTIAMPKPKDTSGKWNGKAGSDDVTVTNVVTSPVSTSDRQPLKKWLSRGISPGFVSPMNNGTWSCAGNTLTVKLTFTANPRATSGWELSR